MRALLLVLGLSIAMGGGSAGALNWKCWVCEGAVEVLKFGYERNVTRDEIIRMADFFCRHFAEKDTLICKGITSQFKEPFLYVLEQLILKPSQLCGLVIRDCGVPFNPFNSRWTLPLPPPRPNGAVPPTPTTTPNLRVLQISDIHFDFNYQPGSEADCQSEICCQGDNGTSININQPAGYWGTPAKCDLPYWTVESMFRHINATEGQEVDYVMLTGDYMSHSDWTYTESNHLSVIANLTQLLYRYLPNTPTLWAIGNHEGVPVNSFAPHFAPKQFQPHWLYKAISSAGKQWLSRRAKKDTIYRGSYSVMLTSHLKLISLNTGYCEVTNFFLYLNQTDPDQTLSWLVEELYESEEKGERVHIMAHIPPGDGECLEGWSHNYYRIVNRFASTIKGQFFGHVHVDSFSVFYEDMNNFTSPPTSMLYVSPSVTTYENLNPAYRIYIIDGGSDYEVKEAETYFLNLTEANAGGEGELPQWKLLYRATEEYGLADLSPSSWNELSERVRSNASTFNTFFKNYVRRNDYVCDEKCRRDMLCQMRSSHHNLTSLCPGAGVGREEVEVAVGRFTNKEEAMISHKEFNGLARKAVWRKLFKWMRGSG